LGHPNEREKLPGGEQEAGGAVEGSVFGFLRWYWGKSKADELLGLVGENLFEIGQVALQEKTGLVGMAAHMSTPKVWVADEPTCMFHTALQIGKILTILQRILSRRTHLRFAMCGMARSMSVFRLTPHAIADQSSCYARA
jgi:hypothetical protein